MEYNFVDIEKKWQQRWRENKTYKVDVDASKPKYYVLDMFPYPSGAGLHVGHPLGYIASDIYSRFKRLEGYNVLHPMGYDAFGLPAEQYAIQTGQHPAITTDINIKRYREQLDKIGFSYDWSREYRTCDPSYYKWTQWAFILMFESYYNNQSQKAEPIANLVEAFKANGNLTVEAACGEVTKFSAAEWASMPEVAQQEILMQYRIAYLADTMVNWCAELGTVLANDEVKDGLSVRGGFPVVQRKMRQWSLRVSAYAQRLLDEMETIDWTDSLKEIQRNWIGRSQGAQMFFDLAGTDKKLEIFTTRPDTIFGVTFMVMAPEHEMVAELTTPEYAEAVKNYIEETKKRSERERMMEAKRVSGQFTGAYAINPFNGKQIPIYLSDYVLIGYGTGAIMAVPAHDSRDYAFAKHFGIDIIEVVSGGDITNESYDAKEGKLVNSDFLNGLDVKEAVTRAIDEVESRGIGKRQINYRLRDAIFSRQRYWGEPFPIYFKDGMPYPVSLDKLPLELPEVDAFLPTETGEPPLGRAKSWQTEDGYPFELSTMPGFAGSSAYYLRYMDPTNDKALVSKEANEYWRNVDLYIGGTEHATGHLIYSRFWNKFLYDHGYVVEKEPFKKLINQGMIQGRSNFVYRHEQTKMFVSYDIYEDFRNGIDKNGNPYLPNNFEEELKKSFPNVDLSSTAECNFTEIHVDVNIVNNDILDQEAFKNWLPEYKNAEFLVRDGKYVCGWAVEKMSKSMFNVVNPDDIVERYGADTLRMYEMFLGPLEQSKPWDTKGIDGVYRFLRKFWRLFFTNEGNFEVTAEKATADELKALHKTIKKVREDIENFSFNTSVSAFMVCVNELTESKCSKREILEPLTVLLSPFAPHITEELWSLLGNATTINDAKYPVHNEEYLVETSFEYPVSFNGKLRFKKNLPLNLNPKQIEEAVLADEQAGKFLEGKAPKKVIVVPGKIVNIVI